MALLDFDASSFDMVTAAPSSGYTPLPSGEYPVHIVGSEMRATKSGTGHYIEFTLEVLDGEYAGRKLFDRLNIDNPNQQAVAIARRVLAQICHAVGVLQLQDTEQLHHRPMVAIVQVEPGRDGYGPRNVVRGYKRVQQQPVPPAGERKKAKVPWEE